MLSKRFQFRQVTPEIGTTTNLNSMRSPGRFTQTSVLSVTLLNNYPVAGVAGTLDVSISKESVTSIPYVVQRWSSYRTLNGNNTPSAGDIWERTSNGLTNAWTEWVNVTKNSVESKTFGKTSFFSNGFIMALGTPRVDGVYQYTACLNDFETRINLPVTTESGFNQMGCVAINLNGQRAAFQINLRRISIRNTADWSEIAVVTIPGSVGRISEFKWSKTSVDHLFIGADYHAGTPTYPLQVYDVSTGGIAGLPYTGGSVFLGRERVSKLDIAPTTLSNTDIIGVVAFNTHYTSGVPSGWSSFEVALISFDLNTNAFTAVSATAPFGGDDIIVGSVGEGLINAIAFRQYYEIVAGQTMLKMAVGGTPHSTGSLSNQRGLKLYDIFASTLGITAPEHAAESANLNVLSVAFSGVRREFIPGAATAAPHNYILFGREDTGAGNNFICIDDDTYALTPYQPEVVGVNNGVGVYFSPDGARAICVTDAATAGNVIRPWMPDGGYVYDAGTVGSEVRPTIVSGTNSYPKFIAWSPLSN